jgi:hypothetical protein
MIPMATKRCFAAWFGALFLIAQIFGVVPIISEHAAHIAQASFAVCAEKVPHGQCHYHGDSDGFVRHHELQDLCGAFTCTVTENQIRLVRLAPIPYAADALSEADPTLLERPPKHVFSV